MKLCSTISWTKSSSILSRNLRVSGRCQFSFAHVRTFRSMAPTRNIRPPAYHFTTVNTSPKVKDYEAFCISGGKQGRTDAAKLLQNYRPKVEGRTVFFGCGAVALCCLDLFDRMIDVCWEQVTLIDMLDLENAVLPYINKGALFAKETLTETNYQSIFKKYCSPGDVVIDLTVDTGSLEFMKWCLHNRVAYLSSSVEAWHSRDPSKFDPVKQCQFYEFDATELWKQEIRNSDLRSSTTIIYGLGANPGLVNLFLKQNLEDLAKYYLKNNDPDTTLSQEIDYYLRTQRWNKLSQILGVKAIHISEYDTQETAPEHAKKPGECVNTWSIDGMYYEWIFLRSEIAWGTHEKRIPDGAQMIEIDKSRGQSNVVLLPTKGKDSTIRSLSPGGEFIANAVTHEENYEIGLGLNVYEGDNLVYRPTVNFAYRPSPGCRETLKEIAATPGEKLQKNRRILSNEIITGRDALGVLTMGHLYNGWWTGSLLDIKESRKLVGRKHNATTLQVAIGVLAGMAWMLENKNAGVLSPSDLPHKQILLRAYPFLGPFISIPVKWKPCIGDKCTWTFPEFSLYDKPHNNI